jgi:hypothetical protein
VGEAIEQSEGQGCSGPELAHIGLAASQLRELAKSK